MKKCMYMFFIATVIIFGFNRCSSDDKTEEVDDAVKSVTISISAPSTYSEEPTAVGQMPLLRNLHVFFTDGVTIRVTGAFLPGDIVSGFKTFSNVPGSASNVIIIGNAFTHTTDPMITNIQVGDPLSKLNAVMFQQVMQTDPHNGVNLHGSALVASGRAAVTLSPAISRIEIGRVNANPNALIPLETFELAGIYINNTYTRCGTDYLTLPTEETNILNYGARANVWTDGSYPGRFKDEWSTSTAGTSFTPSGTNKWAYFVMPIAAGTGLGGIGNGTTIDGKAHTSVPHIVVKVKNAKAEGYQFPTTSYATVSEIHLGGVPLTELTKGKVYSIDSLAIGGEHLTETPETEVEQQVVVEATVTQWIDEPVTPAIP